MLIQRLNIASRANKNNESYPEAIRLLTTVSVPANPVDSLNDSIDTRPVLYTMSYRRVVDELQLEVKVNGLKIKALLDASAEQATIAGTEAEFLIKNKYIQRSEIVDDYTVVLQSVEVDGCVLHNVRVKYVKHQEVPLILNLPAFQSLGSAQINSEKQVIEIR